MYVSTAQYEHDAQRRTEMLRVAELERLANEVQRQNQSNRSILKTALNMLKELTHVFRIGKALPSEQQKYVEAPDFSI